MVRPRQAALVARRIGRVPIGLFAHRRYIADHGMPSDMNELQRHAIIGFDRDDSGYRGLGAGLRVTRELFSFRSDSDLAQLAALRAGLGIAGCQVPIARRDADLIAVLPDELVSGSICGSRCMRICAAAAVFVFFTIIWPRSSRPMSRREGTAIRAARHRSRRRGSKLPEFGVPKVVPGGRQPRRPVLYPRSFRWPLRQ